MKKNKSAQKSQFTIVGYLGFFLLVCGVATCSILAYTFIYDSSGESKVTTAILTLAVLIALALVFTLIDALRRKYTVQRPVQSIVRATKQITAGDFTVQLKPLHAYGKYDEFDVIMENINRMTAELNKNEVLKADFVANVSHEIKTPLALISNYAVALSGDNLPPEIRKEYAQTLLAASKRLSDLITNILKLNKLENQEIFPDKTAIELGEQLRECVLGFDEKLEQKGITLNCDIDDMTIVSDVGFLEIIWNNLLSNAVKFTPGGGEISVSLKEDRGFAVATVADTGCGMDSEVGARIFDKFYQGDSSRAIEGNGLGLTLVKRVIDILGGEILVSSQAGKGSIFTVKIRKDNR